MAKVARPPDDPIVRLRAASACAVWVSEGLRLMCDVDAIDEELAALGGLEHNLTTLADELERAEVA
jgi:hypothetical protein